MGSENLRVVSDDLRALHLAIGDVKSILVNRRQANEDKFDRNQPRAPEGTSTGG